MTASSTPAPPDGVTAPWWEATRERRLTVQRCRTCGTAQHHPRPLCTTCGGGDLTFEDAAGTGTVHTFTVVHRAPVPDRDVPYVVAIVTLDEGVRLLTELVDVDPDAVRCEQPVTVRWRALDDGRHLPVFALA